MEERKNKISEILKEKNAASKSLINIKIDRDHWYVDYTYKNETICFGIGKMCEGVAHINVYDIQINLSIK